MKKAFTQPLRAGAGFTLLELVVVLIILGVLATLGLTQYGRMVEKSRSAEARQIIGDMRKLAAAYRFANGTVTGISNTDLNVGTASDQIPGSSIDNCRSSHYFYYGFTSMSDPWIQIWAYRCYGGYGKTPSGTSSGQALNLQTNLVTGSDAWFGAY